MCEHSWDDTKVIFEGSGETFRTKFSRTCRNCGKTEFTYEQEVIDKWYFETYWVLENKKYPHPEEFTEQEKKELHKKMTNLFRLKKIEKLNSLK